MDEIKRDSQTDYMHYVKSPTASELAEIPRVIIPDMAALAEQLAENDPMRYYLAKIDTVPLLSPEEEEKLWNCRHLKGDEAHRTLTEANLRLVVAIARQHVGYGLPFIGLVQEGNYGLIKAVERFDQYEDGDFPTYAAWWINFAIEHELYQCIVERPSVQAPCETIRHYLKVTMYKNLVRSSAEELDGEELDIGQSFKAEEIQRIVKHAEATRRANAFEPRYKELPTITRDYLERSNLRPREVVILERRLGLIDGYKYSIEELAEQFNVSPGRIRQIEARALFTLRRARSRKFVGLQY